MRKGHPAFPQDEEDQDDRRRPPGRSASGKGWRSSGLRGSHQAQCLAQLAQAGLKGGVLFTARAGEVRRKVEDHSHPGAG